MRRLEILGWGAFICLMATSAQAGLIIENSLLYSSSALTTSSASTSSKLFGNISVGATIPKDYQVGWNVNYLSRSDNPGSGATTLSGTEMGPRFGIFIGKQQTFSVAVVWHAIASATYTASGGSAESLSGSGFQGELGYAPQISNHLFAGFKLIYNSVSYSKKTDSSNLTSSVSYSQSGVLPVLYLSWRF